LVGGRELTKVAVLGTRYSDLSIEEEILAPLGAEIVSGDGSSADAIVDQAEGAAVILAGSGPRFDAATLDRLSARAIVRYGVGTESIDLEAASARGMWVAYVPDYATEAVALHALALALAAARALPAADAKVRSGEWGLANLRPLHLPSAMTAGVVGLGRIGHRVAQLFRAVGFAVRGYDPFVDDIPDGVERVDLGEVLRCDVVSLHAPARSDHRPLIGASELASMKPGCILVNTARGSLIDQDALIEALKVGRPGVAALDVFATEPPNFDAFQAVSKRLILSPHMAWYSEESERDLRQKTAHEAARLLRGEDPIHPVVSPRELQR
jgi:D-3-phosphoglycerate dehydrogenase